MIRSFKPETVVAAYQPMLTGVVEDAKADLPNLQVNKQAFVLASVYLTILQSTIEAANLMREPTTVTIGGVVRSILESYADLCSLAKNPLYARRMLATLYDQRYRLFQDMLASPSNQYHASLAQQLDPAAEMAASAQQLDVEKHAGFHPLSNFDRMAAADLNNEYRSMYWQLCLESHNSIASIEARHIVERSGSHALVLAQNNLPGTMLKYYDSLISMLIESSLLLHSRANPQGASRWQTWQANLQQYRAANIPNG